MLCTGLTSSHHTDKLKRSLLDILEKEHELLSIALDDPKNQSDNDQGILYHRFDQMRFLIAIAEGSYKTDPNKLFMDNDIIEITT